MKTLPIKPFKLPSSETWTLKKTNSESKEILKYLQLAKPQNCNLYLVALVELMLSASGNRSLGDHKLYF